MSVKVLHTGDWHIDYNATRLGQKHIINGTNQYYTERMTRLQKLIDYAVGQNVQYIFLGGDIHNRSNPPPIEYMHLQQLLYEIPFFIQVHIIPGNHDEISRKGSPLSLLQHLRSNVHVHTEFDTFKDENGIRFFFAPWRTPNDQLRAINLSSDLSRVLLCHVGVTGIDGMHWGEVDGEPGKIHIQELIDLNCQAIMLNHHHDQVELAENIWYSGSPECFNFGEEKQTKGALLWDFQQNKQNGIWRPTITPLKTEYPAFITYTPEEFMDLSEEHSLDAYIRVKGIVSEEEKKAIREKRNRLTVFGIKLNLETPPLQRKERLQGENDTKILRNFLDKQQQVTDLDNMISLDESITQEIQNEE